MCPHCTGQNLCSHLTHNLQVMVLILVVLGFFYYICNATTFCTGFNHVDLRLIQYDPLNCRTHLLQIHKQKSYPHCIQDKCQHLCWIIENIMYQALCNLFSQLLYDSIYSTANTLGTPRPHQPRKHLLSFCCSFSSLFLCLHFLLSHSFPGHCFFVTNLISRSLLCYLFIVAHTILCQLSFPLFPHEPSLFLLVLTAFN